MFLKYIRLKMIPERRPQTCFGSIVDSCMYVPLAPSILAIFSIPSWSRMPPSIVHSLITACTSVGNFLSVYSFTSSWCIRSGYRGLAVLTDSSSSSESTTRSFSGKSMGPSTRSLASLKSCPSFIARWANWFSIGWRS